MSDLENILSRWSRRKRDAAEKPKDAKRRTPDVAAMHAPQGSSDEGPAVKKDSPGTPGTEPLFDPASLPPIDSITRATDIRAFLVPGVPAELTRAALRRVWSADPAIRDYIGPSEASWNFNDPSAMAGFGPLEMTDAVRREVERIVGNLVAEDKATAQQAAVASNDSESIREEARVTSQSRDRSKAEARRFRQGAGKQKDSQRLARRSRGRALPK